MMLKTVATYSRSVTQETRFDASRDREVDPETHHGQIQHDEAPLRSPQEFYSEVTKRPDVREILKQLAES